MCEGRKGLKGISRAPPLHGAWPQWVGVPDKPASPPPHCPPLPLGIPGPCPLKPRPGGTEEGRVFRTARRTWSRTGLRGSPRGCPCKGGTPPGAPWAERLALSPPPLSAALFCDYYNPKGHCEWHYQPCGAPYLRTCRNPRGQYLHDVRGLEGALLPCWSGRGRAGETVVGAKVCPGDPGWAAPDPSGCFCGHSLKLPMVWWGPGLGAESRRG